MKENFYEKTINDKVDVKLGNVTKKISNFQIPSNPDLSFTYLPLNDHPEFVDEGARLISEKIKSFDITDPYFITTEASTISLAHVLRTKYGINGEILYKKERIDDVNPVFHSYTPITSKTENKLFLDINKANSFKNKTMVIIDSIVTTGETLKAMYHLLTKAGVSQEKIHSAIVLFAEGKPRNELKINEHVKLPIHSFSTLKIYENSSSKISVSS